MSETVGAAMEKFLASHGPFEATPCLIPGDKVGDWEVTAFLGRGGSAEVYRAKNCVSEIVGALKVLIHNDIKACERFKREIRLVADAKGAAFPKFYGAGEEAGRLYFAEELLESMELPAKDAAVARYVLGVATAVEELHKRGFVHRDIKPANIMVRPTTGECVLIDMGLAKDDSDTPHSRTDTLSVVDGHAVGVGTPGFSAPEQFVGGRIGAAADIHALGVLANTCFNGRPPKVWIPIIRRSTSSIPEQRYATVAEFILAVRRRHAFRLWILVIAASVVTTVAAISITAMREVALPSTDLGSKPAQPHAEPTRLSAETVTAAEKQPESSSRDSSSGGLLGAVSDVLSGDRGNYDIITNGSITVTNIFELGKTRLERDAFVTRIALNGRDVTVSGEVRLKERQTIEIVGPGRLTASIAGPRGASVEISRRAALINLTEIPYPESKMKFILNGACYMNFKNLDQSTGGDNIRIGWVDWDEGTPSIRYRGPDSYKEVRLADKKANIERYLSECQPNR